MAGAGIGYSVGVHVGTEAGEQAGWKSGNEAGKSYGFRYATDEEFRRDADRLNATFDTAVEELAAKN